MNLTCYFFHLSRNADTPTRQCAKRAYDFREWNTIHGFDASKARAINNERNEIICMHWALTIDVLCSAFCSWFLRWNEAVECEHWYSYLKYIFSDITGRCRFRFIQCNLSESHALWNSDFNSDVTRANKYLRRHEMQTHCCCDKLKTSAFSWKTKGIPWNSPVPQFTLWTAVRLQRQWSYRIGYNLELSQMMLGFFQA